MWNFSYPCSRINLGIFLHFKHSHLYVCINTGIHVFSSGIMNMPNQGARQVFLYDHGRPHWSQGGPLFYDRRVPPPPPQMGNFPNPQIQGPSPQWLRGPFIGGPGPGPNQNQQQFDGFGIIPWGNQNNYNNRYCVCCYVTVCDCLLLYGTVCDVFVVTYDSRLVLYVQIE